MKVVICENPNCGKRSEIMEALSSPPGGWLTVMHGYTPGKPLKKSSDYCCAECVIVALTAEQDEIARNTQITDEAQQLITDHAVALSPVNYNQ